ncbi:MAG: aspartate aminotransferase family protein, partial [Deltaproteobacteria bacterium]
VLIMDEIQVGMGRTGKLFAHQWAEIEPDVMTLAKALGGGLPLGAMLAKEKYAETLGAGSHGSTFGGNPISCRAALVTIDLLTGGLVKNAAVTGAYFKEELVKMAGTHRLIGDVRGVGLMVAIELVTDREKKTKAVKERNRVVELAFRKGLLLLGCGENSVRFIPALTVSRKDIGIALSILDEVLTEVEG